MTVTLRQIEYALAVDEAGAICAAAKALHVAQPSLSQQISSLERSLGVMLFERTAMGTSTTPAGRAFLAEAQQAMQAVERAREVAVRAASSMRKDIIIGANEMTPALWLAQSVASLRASAPKLSARVVTFSDTESLIEAVTSGGIDVGVGPVHAASWRERKQRVGSLELAMAVSHDASPRLGGPVPAGQLGTQDWVTCPSNAHALSELRKSIGDTRIDNPSAANLSAAVSYVDAGLGATLVPNRQALPDSLDLVAINPPPTVDVYAFALRSTDVVTFNRIAREITAHSTR
ncbi:LysR family transcriptional regulator [Streptomyces sp. NBC_00554]|uniref:LysR family transcriptional regulator n=1 Tax=Streptomyces sp. NBC_00554 TaxID=2903661 RepID=UPI00352F9ECE|nr:LysR family transcriptional regulator [Streptomyces sp. NBC_00554]